MRLTHVVVSRSWFTSKGLAEDIQIAGSTEQAKAAHDKGNRLNCQRIPFVLASTRMSRLMAEHHANFERERLQNKEESDEEEQDEQEEHTPRDLLFEFWIHEYQMLGRFVWIPVFDGQANPPSYKLVHMRYARFR